MKGSSMEKIRIEKSNEKNVAVDKSKSRDSSVVPTKKPVQSHHQTVTIKQSKHTSKSNCVLGGNVVCKNLYRKDGSPEGRVLTVTNKGIFEKVKKNKSLDQVKKTSSKYSSKLSLEKGLDGVQKPKKQKTSSEVQLRREIPRSPRGSTLSNIFQDYSTKLNFFGCPPKSNSENLRGGQWAAGKSISFDSLQYTNPFRNLPKSVSVENGKKEKLIGVFNVNKRSYSQTPDAFVKRSNFTGLWGHGGSKDFIFKGLNSKTKSNQKLFSDEKKFYKTNAFLGEPTEQTDSNTVWSKTKGFKSSEKTLNDDEMSQGSAEKKTVQVCQCLHFHTEDGMKKLCLQSNPKTRELGQKFFRVNYYSKGHEEDEEQKEKTVELVDKGTFTDNEPEPTVNSGWERVKRNTLTGKTKRNILVEKKVSAKLKTNNGKQETARRKEGKHESNGNQTRILGQAKLPEKRKFIPVEIISHDSNTEIKTKKQTEQTDRGKLFKKPKKSWETEKNEEDDALEELKLIECLLTRLNAVESMKIKQKLDKSPDGKRLAKIITKAGGMKEEIVKNAKLLLDIEADEEYLRQKRKLRYAIIRQLRNWLKVTDYK